MEKIRSSNLAKLICYVLIPILVIIAIVSMIHIIFLEEYNIKDETKYEQTQDFANRYLQNIVDRVNECKQITEEYSNFVKIQNEDDGSIVDLGELNEEKLNMLKQMLVNTAKEVKDVVVDNKKDDKDITDELINEDDENLNK